MDEIEIKGKKYISSKRASELSGYAKDYIGQLARREKIPGVRMGRAWYVEKSALLGDLAAPSSKNEPQSQKNLISRIQKNPVSPAMIKALGYLPKPLPATWSEISYFTDTAELIPTPKKAESSSIPLSFKTDSNSDNLEHMVRIKILEEKVQKKVPEWPKVAGDWGSQKTDLVLKKTIKIRKRRDLNRIQLSAAALAAAMGVFFFFASGFFLSSEIQFMPNGVYAANILIGSQYAKEILQQIPILQQGWQGIGHFFILMGSSFGQFFSAGGQFLVSVFRFIF